MIEIKFLFGYISGFITLLSCCLYIRAIYKQKFSSNIFAWGIWTLVTLMVCIGYYESSGLVASIWVSFAYFIGTLGIFIALIRYSTISIWTNSETITAIAVLFTFIAWIISHSAILELTLILFVDICGSFILVKNILHNKKTEYPLGWYMALIANTLNLFAVEKWNYTNSIYPIYLFSLTLIVSIILFFPYSKRV